MSSRVTISEIATKFMRAKNQVPRDTTVPIARSSLPGYSKYSASSYAKYLTQNEAKKPAARLSRVWIRIVIRMYLSVTSSIFDFFAFEFVLLRITFVS
jgi:hypothetical protein